MCDGGQKGVRARARAGRRAGVCCVSRARTRVITQQITVIKHELIINNTRTSDLLALALALANALALAAALALA